MATLVLESQSAKVRDGHASNALYAAPARV